MFISNHRGKASKENSGCFTHATRGRKNKWRESAELDHLNSLFICTSLLTFMLFVDSLQGRAIRLSEWAKNPDINKCPSKSLPQKPRMLTSNLASSRRLHVLPWRISPSSGCNCGSTTTSLHTSRSRLAVRSRTSLWRIEGYPPWGHDIAWSTEKSFPQAQVVGNCAGLQP